MAYQRVRDPYRTSEVHHVVYRTTDGADDDWASYADWLRDHSELPETLGSAPTRSHLVLVSAAEGGDPARIALAR